MVMEKHVPEGYKQTEVGVIPEDWELRKIAELANIFGRIGFRGYTKRDIVKEGEGAISISPSNIFDTRINFEKCTYISWYKYEESPEIKIENNDVILVKTGSTFGKAALVENLPNKATINPQLVVFKYIRIPNIYLSYLINSKIIQNQIHKAVVGGAIPTLSQSMVKNFIVPIPHFTREQQAIATALSDVDNLITSLEQLIEKKKAIKHGTMQELLTGRRRLKGFGEGKGYKQTELGMTPEDWNLLKITDLCEQKGIKIGPFGSQLKKEYLQNKGYKVYGQENVYQKDMSIGDRYISSSRFSLLKTCEIRESDFLISMMGTIGKCMIVPKCFHKGIMDSHLIRLRLRRNIVNENYFYYIFQFTITIQQINQFSVGGIMDGLSSKIIKSLLFILPSTIEEQKAIAHVLSEIDTEVGNLKAKVDKYKQIKQGMMQNLLTGRIRLA